MTPDTSAYMIAGFLVIFAGLVLYLLSLFLRTRKIRQKAARLDSNWNDEKKIFR